MGGGGVTGDGWITKYEAVFIYSIINAFMIGLV